MNPPPIQPPEKQGSRVWIVFVAVGVVLMAGLAYGAFRVFRAITNTNVVTSLDQQFGDQHLKTAVALIELHKIRNGRYPETLAQLRFTGQWDQLALQSVRYIAAKDGSSYFVDVQRGWIGKPTLELPAEFWQGTGYDPRLAPLLKDPGKR